MNLEAFFETEPKPVWGNPVELEVLRRIRLSVAAYSYEFLDEIIMSDAEFDKMCGEVNLKVDTGNKVCDNYFRKHFNPSTGQWIRKHPELKRIAYLYKEYYKK